MCKKRHFGLTICLTFFIFLISVVSTIFLSALLYLLLSFHIIRADFSSSLLPIFLLGFLSIFISTCLTPIVGHIPLRPLRRIIEATDELAKGNFDTRIHFEYPPELCNLSKSFNSMACELQNTTMLRNDFINNFSHEFKTPIVSIKGFAKLLQDDSLPEEQRKEYIRIIIRESDRLANLATKILDLSKVEGQTQLNQVHSYNLAEQIRLSFLLLENKWSKKEIDFDIDLDEINVSANEEMMQQVFVNLLDNAIKFTPEHGFISLSLKTVENEICFCLKDTGIGMDEATIDHIFHKFYQADSSHQQEGNGLGMTLVKKIIDLHGGHIKIKSKLGKGTTIFVYLPCYRSNFI